LYYEPYPLYPLPLIKGKGRSNKEGLTPLLYPNAGVACGGSLKGRSLFKKWRRLSCEMVVDYGEAVKELVTRLRKIP